MRPIHHFGHFRDFHHVHHRLATATRPRDDGANLEATQIRAHEVWCIECQTGHVPAIVDGAVKVACDWDSPAQLALMAKDPTIVRPSVLRAREASLIAQTARIYTEEEVQALRRADAKEAAGVAVAEFLAQLRASGVEIVSVTAAKGAVAAPAGGA